MIKKAILPHKKEEPIDVLPKSKSPLVFISHDTRDAEIAEKFGSLLKSASAGALKFFHSSAKKPTQGIEYGSEWYPAIMEKIDEATDVVCLLTKNSVDRPWILYEAGVAKGKLNTKVTGIAIGIPLSSAVRGPFAQFQNLEDDIVSLTKLVLELVKKVPGLDPDEQNVKTLIETFKKEVTEIINKNSKPADAKKETVDESSVAKIFEEVKIMFQDLPSKIENRIEPDFRRKRRKLHPMMLHEMMHFGFDSKDPSIAFLMMVSLFKDDFPWFYEVGLETFRELKTAKTTSDKKKLLANFEKSYEFLLHPMMRDFSTKSEDSFFLIMESRHIFHDFFEKFYKESKKD